MAAPDEVARPLTVTYDVWGPETKTETQGVATRVPRKRRAWGAVDILTGVLAIVLAQVVLLPILVVMAIFKYNIDMDSPGAADALMDAVMKVATSGPGLVLAVACQWAAFVGVPAWVTRRNGHASLAKDFGLVFKRSDLGYGLLFALGLQALMLGISWTLQQLPFDFSEADNTGQVTDQVGLTLVFMILAASIGAPVTEELFFRGLMMRGMLRTFAKVDLAPALPGVTDRFHPADVSERRRKIGTVVAVLLSSFIFGLMHLQTGTNSAGSSSISLGAWAVVAQTGILGLFFAVVALRTKRLGLTITAHFFFNSISVALVLLTS